MRLFLNDERISTAVKTKSGSILQVYPIKTTFSDEVAWRAHWDEALKPKIILRIGYPEDRAPAGPSHPVTATAPKVKKPSWQERPKLGKHAVKAVSLSDWKFTKQQTFTVPAGTYYIGDLYNALSDDIYVKVYGGTEYRSGLYEEKGTNRVFAMGMTSWSRGEFPSSDGKRFAVNSSTLGICSDSLMTKSGDGGHICVFESPVTCHFNFWRFTFTSGDYNLVIDTTPPPTPTTRIRRRR